MTKATIFNRLQKLELAHGEALATCPTCRRWNYYVVVLDRDTGQYDPCPPVCPDCGRRIASEVVYKDLWDDLLPDRNDSRWQSDPVWAAKWGSYDWRESVRRR